MKSIFFTFSLLSRLYFTISSPAEQLYDDLGLMRKYHRCIVDQHHVLTWSGFIGYAYGYYNQSPMECLKILERNENNFAFKVLFCKALRDETYTAPTAIGPGSHHGYIISFISYEILKIFANCCRLTETEFKTKFELVSKLIRLAERNLIEWKSRGIKSDIIDNLGDLIPIWRFLAQNISIDYAKGTIDYNSAFRTINTIISLLKTEPPTYRIPPNLRNLVELLKVYLFHIRLSGWDAILDLYHHHKALIIFLTLEDGDGISLGIHPIQLLLKIKRFTEVGPNRLEPVVNLFKRTTPPNIYCKLLKNPRRISSFLKFTHFLEHDNFKKFTPCEIWEIRALAELELYLSRNGVKVQYNVNSNFN